MGRRSTVATLPDEVRALVDSRLRTKGYGDYDALAELVRSMGHKVTRSALHRYGARLRRVDALNGYQAAQVSLAGARIPTHRTGLLHEAGVLTARLRQIHDELALIEPPSHPEI